MSKKNKARRVLTTEFKQECVNLVINQGYSMSQAASAMQVGLSSMQRWTRQYKHELLGVTPLARAFTPEQQRIQALEAQVKQLKRELAFSRQFALANARITIY